MKARHEKLDQGRCCWICGRAGGYGATTILRLLGYDVPKDQIGYAHMPCVNRERAKEKQS